MEKKGRRVKKCIHMYVNAKMIPDETIPGSVGGEIKENGEGGEFKYDICDNCKNFCQFPMYPHPTQ
jgi:hypothetical protein